MTSALRKPAAGYNTLSRLESRSSRPSMATWVAEPLISRMEPYAECYLDRVDQLWARAGARAPCRCDEEQGRELQSARGGHRRGDLLQEGLRGDGRGSARRAHQARLRGL